MYIDWKEVSLPYLREALLPPTRRRFPPSLNLLEGQNVLVFEDLDTIEVSSCCSFPAGTT